MENILIGIEKITADDAYNIVAQKAELERTIRAFTPEIRERTKQLLAYLSKQTAQIYGGDALFQSVSLYTLLRP